MPMTHRERLETAWSFQEPDRVPIELSISEYVRKHPRGQRLVGLIEEHADSITWAPGANWGFFGFPNEYHEETIEDRPGEYKKMRRVHETAAGTFTALTHHPAGEWDYHWEKRFVSTVEDLRRLAETPRPKLPWDADAWRRRIEEVGDSALAVIGVMHPLGSLVRNATMEEMYAWFYEDRKLVHQFLEAANAQVAETVKGMVADGIGPYFSVCAHEMLLPPWMGHKLFDEFVFPYDKTVNDVIHSKGGKLRAHCHGNCMDFLEELSEMGIDAIEPLEPPPAGDVDLAEAKRRVGDRMMLSGNIISKYFMRESAEDVRARVKAAIQAAAPGGGYSLRTCGGAGGTSVQMPEQELLKAIENCEAYLLAGLEFGQYPIKG